MGDEFQRFVGNDGIEYRVEFVGFLQAPCTELGVQWTLVHDVVFDLHLLFSALLHLYHLHRFGLLVFLDCEAIFAGFEAAAFQIDVFLDLLQCFGELVVEGLVVGLKGQVEETFCDAFQMLVEVGNAFYQSFLQKWVLFARRGLRVELLYLALKLIPDLA